MRAVFILWKGAGIQLRGFSSGRPLIGITVNRDYRRERLWLPFAYSRRLEEAGGIPLLLPPLQESAAGVMPGPLKAVLLGGGGDVAPFYYGDKPAPGLGEVDPERDAWEIALVRAAFSQGMPLLGICRGMQLLNVALGGTLLQDIGVAGYLQHHQKAPRHHPSHCVELLPRTRLAGILGRGHLAVNSFHHQAVEAIAPGLQKAALSPDGIVEALEDREHPFLMGVQWHPESLLDRASEFLFRAFIGAAADAAL
jgi:putative glutamine amidotransferase